VQVVHRLKIHPELFGSAEELRQTNRHFCADSASALTPNPFQKGTTIHFDLLRPSHVTVRVFSVRGTLVRTLADAAYPAGRHSLDWNGSDDRGRPASSSIYFCEFRAGSEREVRRLVLTR